MCHPLVKQVYPELFPLAYERLCNVWSNRRRQLVLLTITNELLEEFIATDENLDYATYDVMVHLGSYH